MIKISLTSVSILTVILCILKLEGIITISWLWCFGFIWMPIAIFITIMFLIILYYVIKALLSK